MQLVFLSCVILYNLSPFLTSTLSLSLFLSLPPPLILSSPSLPPTLPPSLPSKLPLSHLLSSYPPPPSSTPPIRFGVLLCSVSSQHEGDDDRHLLLYKRPLWGCSYSCSPPLHLLKQKQPCQHCHIRGELWLLVSTDVCGCDYASTAALLHRLLAIQETQPRGTGGNKSILSPFCCPEL